MASQIVPIVLIPRFTTYVGAGTYTTIGLEVSRFQSMNVTIWRGPLIGSVPGGAAVSIQLETSPDNETWTADGAPITTANAHSFVEALFTRPWMRLKVTLTADASNVVALTCWATGFVEMREAA